MYLPQDFIRDHSEAVLEASLNTPLLPSVIMAQMGLETGWGKSKVGNNMFGIKAEGQKSPYWEGAVMNADTTEFVAGQARSYNLAFRAYRSITDSIKDHSYFLLQNPRYRKAGVFAAKTAAEQAIALQSAGYATDPEYADKLIQVMDRYDLYELDKKKSG
ncbi:MAG: glucosaminidase domain-containing protein [Bacteroidetes bacterium]|nr:glucosaminidase domain-containing protein [Bacteroidota bacterium]